MVFIFFWLHFHPRVNQISTKLSFENQEMNREVEPFTHLNRVEVNRKFNCFLHPGFVSSSFQDRITDLQAQTQHFAEVGHFDADSLQDKSRGIAERYDK